ncbi:Uncharacterised protein [Legionella steigerwaltii]|uniref:Dot/Icm secretion system substrate n=2 Tax=Legionella steigerwaltii TaxID=460 RepID=A0A378LJZ7_9GAMM|nr:hypothetical protein Lstg_1487 [Legionella steigerwaltii]STY24401.1 Uncharacterised protein [Legionella steigerwaltii]
MEEAEKNNFPILIKIGEGFKMYRRDIHGTWDFADFDGKIPGIDLNKQFLAEDGSRTTINLPNAPAMVSYLKEQHFLPIPSARSNGCYEYGKAQHITSIKGTGSVPERDQEALADWKSVYQAIRKASETDHQQLSVARDFTLTRLIAHSYSDPKTVPPKGVQEFVSQKFAKMSAEEIAKTLSESKISGLVIVQMLKDMENKDEIINLIIKEKISQLEGELTIKERYEIESSFKGIEKYLPKEFTKMTIETLATALSESKMSGQEIVQLLREDEQKDQIISLIIEKKLSKLKDEFDPEVRAQLESSLKELYRTKIQWGIEQLRTPKKEIKELSNTKNALCDSISMAMAEPDLTLEDCQNLDKVVHHANIAMDFNNCKQSDSIYELAELSDQLVGQKSERLNDVAITCGVLAVFAAMVAIALAPTGIGLIVGLAVAGALAAAAIGTWIGSKATESDVSKKTRDFKDALEGMREQPEVDKEPQMNQSFQ